jgi:Rrf2 family nitric oxide-sensitive transcriptional repressor
MRLTTFTDYSLRVLIYLASKPGAAPGLPPARSTVTEIARAFRVSENHLVKVVHFLGTGGWLDNARGRGGGIRLALPASEINIADVVRLAEASDVPAECFEPGHDECMIVRRCRLRGVLHEAVQSFYASLAKYTLEDLVHEERETIVRMLAIHR